ncbi:MAG: CPBP family intramembrane metalloprotease [Clostridia bacterium]|nr:CPBP family intramembrane metalloprotease [Clostridia bacterium]
MKRFFANLGKAVLYCLAFLFFQVLAVYGLTAVQVLLSFFGGMGLGMGAAVWIGDNMVALSTLLSCALTYLGLWMFFVLRRKHLSREVGFARLPKPLSAIPAPFCAGFGLCILSTFLISYIPIPQSWADSYEVYSGSIVSGEMWLTVIATTFCAPLAEELIFRGLIYTRLRRGMPVGIAALLSALAFGALHGTMLHLLYTIPMGIILCLFYEKYRSLWAPVLLHMGFNLCGCVLGYYPMDTVGMIVGFLCIGAYLTVIGFVMMGWYRRERREVE